MRRRQQGEEEESLLELITDRTSRDRHPHRGSHCTAARSGGGRSKSKAAPVPRAIAVGAAIASHWKDHLGDGRKVGMFARQRRGGCGPSTSTALCDLLRWACLCSVLLASACSLFFICWGGSTRGKAWYGARSKVHFADYKGGIPLMALAFPLLGAAAFCTLFFLPKTPGARGGVGSRWRCADVGEHETAASVVVVSGPASRAAAVTARGFRNCLRFNFRTGSGGGDLNFHRLSLCLVAVPLSLYLAGTIGRHLYGKDLSTNKKLMEVGNSFGMMAVVSLSWFLVPVSRHSIILSVLGWSPVHAVPLHIWSGRMCIVGSVVHGTFHFVRWYRMVEGLVHMVMPPSVCLFAGDGDAGGPTCVNRSTDCTCYYLMRNYTGFLAVVAMIVVLVTSLHYVRRKWYRVFYWVHVTMGPLALIMAVLHYNRLILYLSPSLLYYLASTVPVLAQALSSYRRDGGCRLIDVRHIPDSGGCVEVSFDASSPGASAATTKMAPAQYLKLCVPEISAVWHPFTVVPPPALAAAAAGGGASSSSGGCEEVGCTGEEAAPSSSSSPSSSTTLRIIFRATGPFTTKLSNRLALSCPSLTADPSVPPTMLVDGLYGGPDRLSRARRHDSVVMMAGGIGITPFLSLAPMLHSTLLRGDADGGESFRTREVALHWMCRDEGLIDHVVTNYLLAMTAGKASAPGPVAASSTVGGERGRRGVCNYTFRIVIHHTGAGRDGGVGEGVTASKETHDEANLPSSSTGDRGGPGGETAFTIDDDDDDEDDDKGEEREHHHRRGDEEDAACGSSSNAGSAVAALHLSDVWGGTGSPGSSFEPARFAPEVGDGDGDVHGGLHLLLLRKNVPSFLTFTSISWVGLYIVWYFYVEVQSAKVVWTRSLGLAVASVWSVVTSLVIVAIADRLSSSGRRWCWTSSSGMYSLLGWFSGPTVADRNSTGEEGDDGRCCSEMTNGEGEESELEMRAAASPASRSDDAGIGDRSGRPNGHHRRLSSDDRGLELTPEYVINQERRPPSLHAVIEHRHDGRPNVSQLLDFISMADSPGLFLCGPDRMTTEAKDAVRRQNDRCGFGTINAPPCAVYEEVFGP